eukprot:CAMPEP_0171059172 /NCGR_PEP_ID=MMETSP0766_2-20121228/3031_1 /TAXON_ID=439317 /ORGANISM="Gambierdiscus australes, Strain CAWD 149" /LENGTH=39 /DNA_ID= /DNA_START= /DNA_END= /DNA_ORIENTATION=
MSASDISIVSPKHLPTLRASAGCLTYPSHVPQVLGWFVG